MNATSAARATLSMLPQAIDLGNATVVRHNDQLHIATTSGLMLVADIRTEYDTTTKERIAHV